MTKLRNKTLSRGRGGASEVVNGGGRRVETVCLPKEATMADGSLHKGSAERVLTRSFLARGG